MKNQMKYKISSPKDMGAPKDVVGDAIKLFEDKLKEKTKGSNYYLVRIPCFLDTQTCIKIENLYKEAGWKHVKCEQDFQNSIRLEATTLELIAT